MCSVNFFKVICVLAGFYNRTSSNFVFCFLSRVYCISICIFNLYFYRLRNFTFEGQIIYLSTFIELALYAVVSNLCNFNTILDNYVKDLNQIDIAMNRTRDDNIKLSLLFMLYTIFMSIASNINVDFHGSSLNFNLLVCRSLMSIIFELLWYRMKFLRIQFESYFEKDLECRQSTSSKMEMITKTFRIYSNLLQSFQKIGIAQQIVVNMYKICSSFYSSCCFKHNIECYNIFNIFFVAGFRCHGNMPSKVFGNVLHVVNFESKFLIDTYLYVPFQPQK